MDPDPKPRNVTYPVYSIVSKLVYALLCLAVFTILGKYMSVDYLLGKNLHVVLAFSIAFNPLFLKSTFTDPKYMTSFPSMPITCMLAGTLIRFRFYLIWILADSINNAAGMGFNG